MRHTAAALGLALAYFILVEGVFSGLITRFEPDPKPWLVIPNFNAWVQNGITYPIDTPCMSSPGPTECVPLTHTITLAHGTTYLAVLVAVGVSVAAWAFTHRDVT